MAKKVKKWSKNGIFGGVKKVPFLGHFLEMGVGAKNGQKWLPNSPPSER
jgi:hypothetical protein